MRDMRPLSERFDLTYVRRKHFADRWTGRLGFVAAAATAVTVAAYQIRGDERPYTAGALTKAHDMFASDCTKCHEASMEPGLRGFLMPATDAKCLECHENQRWLHAENQADLFAASIPGHPEMRGTANCAACHMEHQGRNHDLSAVSDQTCVRCHEDLAGKGILKVLASPSRPNGASAPGGPGVEGGAK